MFPAEEEVEIGETKVQLFTIIVSIDTFVTQLLLLIESCSFIREEAAFCRTREFI